MRAIMISVRADIILLDDGEPSAECRLIAVERIEHIKPPEELEAEKHERSMFGQLLETKDLKVPIEHLVEQLGNVLGHFELCHSGARARLATSAADD